eukprot:8037306-Alexandrium_andersonii.AAC.1
MRALARVAACWGVERVGERSWQWPTGEVADLLKSRWRTLPPLITPREGRGECPISSSGASMLAASMLSWPGKRVCS